MADDKTAAEPWPEWATPGQDFDIDGNVWPGSRLDKWLTERAAVRRVAPDRDEVFRVARKATTPGTIGGDDLGRVVDALLASGVLGVPADQRTADRETIARALFARSLDRLGPGYPTEAITWGVTDQESWRQDADAVLAVLVPADQVRAETLEALRLELREADQTPWHVLDAIESRAAAYRKATGA